MSQKYLTTKLQYLETKQSQNSSYNDDFKTRTSTNDATQSTSRSIKNIKRLLINSKKSNYNYNDEMYQYKISKYKHKLLNLTGGGVLLYNSENRKFKYKFNPLLVNIKLRNISNYTTEFIKIYISDDNDTIKTTAENNLETLKEYNNTLVTTIIDSNNEDKRTNNSDYDKHLKQYTGQIKICTDFFVNNLEKIESSAGICKLLDKLSKETSLRTLQFINDEFINYQLKFNKFIYNLMTNNNANANANADTKLLHTCIPKNLHPVWKSAIEFLYNRSSDSISNWETCKDLIELGKIVDDEYHKTIEILQSFTIYYLQTTTCKLNIKYYSNVFTAHSRFGTYYETFKFHDLKYAEKSQKIVNKRFFSLTSDIYNHIKPDFEKMVNILFDNQKFKYLSKYTPIDIQKLIKTYVDKSHTDTEKDLVKQFGNVAELYNNLEKLHLIGKHMKSFYTNFMMTNSPVEFVLIEIKKVLTGLSFDKFPDDTQLPLTEMLTISIDLLTFHFIKVVLLQLNSNDQQILNAISNTDMIKYILTGGTRDLRAMLNDKIISLNSVYQYYEKIPDAVTQMYFGKTALNEFYPSEFESMKRVILEKTKEHGDNTTLSTKKTMLVTVDDKSQIYTTTLKKVINLQKIWMEIFVSTYTNHNNGDDLIKNSTYRCENDFIKYIDEHGTGKFVDFDTYINHVYDIEFYKRLGLTNYKLSTLNKAVILARKKLEHAHAKLLTEKVPHYSKIINIEKLVTKLESTHIDNVKNINKFITIIIDMLTCVIYSTIEYNTDSPKPTNKDELEIYNLINELETLLSSNLSPPYTITNPSFFVNPYIFVGKRLKEIHDIYTTTYKDSFYNDSNDTNPNINIDIENMLKFVDDSISFE